MSILSNTNQRLIDEYASNTTNDAAKEIIKQYASSFDFGINIHKAGADSTYVENWSEGCQVFKKSADFEEFMTIVRKSKDIHGNSFTYTLIESSDIV